MLKTIALWMCMLVAVAATNAQKGTDPVLFMVGSTPVTTAEFRYIYSKTNADKADFSQKSLEEYLELYVKFKMKVQRARELQLDTVETLRRELDGYRRQLAESYLIDREVTDRLVREAFDRSATDLNVSHILFSLGKNPSPVDTLAAYQKAVVAAQRLAKGESFAKVAAEASEDKTTASSGGVLGWITAMLPDGFYDLETAMYDGTKAKSGNMSIVRSPIGYHIVAINDRRPARGEIEVAHILLRDGKETRNANAQLRIDSIYTALKNGASFEDLATQLSEDNATKTKAGYLGFFGINRYEKTFEDAAFGLAKDTDFSAPFRTSVGWHIVKRISRKSNEPYDIAKNRLKPRVQRDGRHALAKKAMTDRIKKENGLTESAENYAALVKLTTADTNFLSYKWKSPEPKMTAELFQLGTKKFTTGDFCDYLFLNSRKRTEGGPRADIADVVRRMYTEYVNESCLKYEETQLDTKYPEFKSLMREYEEGILLFEATKSLVWDKASLDSVGIERFYTERSKNYQWEERVHVNYFSVDPGATSQIDEMRKLAAKKGPMALLEKYNTDSTDVVAWREETLERGRNKGVDAMVWKKGSLGDNVVEKDGTITFACIDEVLPKGQKSLPDARGFVVADYQDYLEMKWVEELQETYKVAVNQDVLRSLIK